MTPVYVGCWKHFMISFDMALVWPLWRCFIPNPLHLHLHVPVPGRRTGKRRRNSRPCHHGPAQCTVSWRIGCHCQCPVYELISSVVCVCGIEVRPPPAWRSRPRACSWFASWASAKARSSCRGANPEPQVKPKRVGSLSSAFSCLKAIL